MKDNTKIQIRAAFLALLATGLSALISYLLTDTQSAWYTSLNLPIFMPPPLVFAVVWAVLYALLAAALFRQIQRGNDAVLWSFTALLTLYALWSYAFFFKHNAVAGLVILLLCIASIICAIRRTWKTDTFSTIVLMLHLAWIAFAAVLNYYIYMAN